MVEKCKSIGFWKSWYLRLFTKHKVKDLESSFKKLQNVPGSYFDNSKGDIYIVIRLICTLHNY